MGVKPHKPFFYESFSRKYIHLFICVAPVQSGKNIGLSSAESPAAASLVPGKPGKPEEN